MKWILREGVDFQPEGPNSRGSTFTQLFQVIPAIEPFYMEWEKKYDSSPVYEWMKSVPWVPIAGVILYVVGIFGGQALMKNRKPFDLKWPLAYWNLALSLFSIMGMVRVVPHLIYLTATKGLGVVACGAPEPLYGNAAVGFWVQAFILSKLAELIDTAFIVLRKKPLQFLHWYHHVTVLLFTWFCYTHENPGIIFVAMNYSVHAIMYGYYFLMAIRVRPSWLKPQFITLMQISQMVVGVATAAFYIMKIRAGEECAVDQDLLVACGIMYSTYLYLFCEFAVRRFILGPKKETAPGKAGASKMKAQ
ncbi:hypothetical protein NSK_001617 [Nannochloropsis salina CCMP1776]|uniref:Elongation of fatty acids protein n=1 Tax=Nannochloropsis salina CCMP1776 TaxID=1027361 RepID=A0A4D9DCN0_9STRA|nr:hypothetical protein NSK_001617 [Nannochloropsis salina CCMP1776]|eukprot:TFJ87285.1 hypothetical protein NSK_001617 [Nannochloropsis salina CCMP1776]